MPVFRYRTRGNWYRGNCHIHSTASDGGKTFAELAQMYAQEGYDFLFRTDHWVSSDVEGDENEYPLLWLDGIELDGRDHGGSSYHVVCLGRFEEDDCLRWKEAGLVAAMEAARAAGCLLVLAHPGWMGNSFQDALRYGFHGVEIYNHVCWWLNGKGDGKAYWNAMLERFPGTLGLAVDDAHIRPEHPGWNGGWIVVNAPDLSRGAILDAIRAGNFYSSCGPEFHAIDYHDGCVTIETSPVQFVRLVGPAHRGDRLGAFDGSTMQEATLRIPDGWSCAYLEIEDTRGRRAWTNTLLAGEG
jgi:hypothetical protein